MSGIHDACASGFDKPFARWRSRLGPRATFPGTAFSRPAMPRLTLDPAQPGALAEAAAWTESTAGGLGATGDTLDRLTLAVAEALANAFEHGQGPVALSIDGGPRVLTACISDAGAGPDVAALAAASLPEDPMATDGRGLFLIRTLSDWWTHQDGVLTLTFGERRPPERRSE